MKKAVKHEFDEGKWQSNFDNYGHGEGNGKSRTSIYKHFKKMQLEPVDDNSEEIPIDEKPKWSTSDWMNSDEVEVGSSTIPKPLSDIAAGKITEMDFKAQGKIVRTMYVGLDRLITHWGRGVMSQPDWTIERTPEDLDSMELATVNMLNYYDIRIPISPPMIWGVTIGSAYVPKISYVMKNRDPSRKKKGFFSRIFRRKKKQVEEKEESDLQ